MRAPVKAALLLAWSLFSACHLRDRAKSAAQIEFHDNLKYAAHSSAELDLYTPRNLTKPTPVVIFIHGGYWRNQSRSYYRPFTGLYQNFGLALAGRGIATAIIDYRIFPLAQPRDQLDDIIAAAAFIKSHAIEYNIDASQLYLAGHSAGGHLALLVSWNAAPQLVRGAIALSPILDIAHMRRSKDAKFNDSLTIPFFGTGENDKRFSPATYAMATSKQALLLFGERDDTYLLDQQNLYKKAFATKGLKQITFAQIAGADHSEMVLRVHTEQDNITDTMVAFVKSNPAGISREK